MLKKLIDILSGIPTVYLVLFPVGLALLIIWMTLSLGGSDVLIPFALFVWGFMGLPMIIRKEVPWLITIRGWIAVLQGWALMLLLWVAALIMLDVVLGGRP